MREEKCTIKELGRPKPELNLLQNKLFKDVSTGHLKKSGMKGVLE